MIPEQPTAGPSPAHPPPGSWARLHEFTIRSASTVEEIEIEGGPRENKARPPLPAVGWGPREAGFAALLAIIAFIASLLVELPAIGKGANSVTFLALGLLAALIWQVMIVRIAFWVAQKSGGGWPNLGLVLPFPGAGPGLHLSRFLRLVIIGYFAAEAITVTYGLIARATCLSWLQPKQQLPDELFNSAGIVALTGLTVVVTAPIAEEILFRGTIFAGFNRAWGFWPAAFASGAFFAVAHAQSGLVIPFTLVGVTLAYVYRQAGSIYANISVHFLFNMLSFVVLVLVPGQRDMKSCSDGGPAGTGSLLPGAVSLVAHFPVALPLRLTLPERIHG